MVYENLTTEELFDIEALKYNAIRNHMIHYIRKICPEFHHVSFNYNSKEQLANIIVGLHRLIGEKNLRIKRMIK